MSLILDALSRAERDRQSDQSPAPTLLSQSPAEQTPSSRGPLQRRWVITGSLVLVATTAIVLAIFMRPNPPADSGESVVAQARDSQTRMAQARESKERASTLASVAPQSAPLASPDPASVSSAGRAEAALEIAPVSSLDLDQQARISALYDNETASGARRAAAATESSASEAAPGEPAGNQATAAVDAGTRAQAAGLRETEAVNTGSSGENRTLDLEEEIDLGTVLAEVRREAQRSGLSPNPVPMLADMPKRFRDSVPTLIYARHNYNTQGGSRVTINGTALGKGQRTRNVEVREILADSVILRYDGTDFRLRSLNSWVNL